MRTCPNDCSYNGYCVNGTCSCYPGFVGKDCSTKVCPGSELVPQKVCGIIDAAIQMHGGTGVSQWTPGMQS